MDEKHLMHFQSETSVFKFLRRSVDSVSIRYSGDFVRAGISLERGFRYSGDFVIAGISLERGFR